MHDSLYFSDHQDPDLAEAVRQVRRRENAAYEPDTGDITDPQDPETIARSRLARLHVASWSA